MYKQILPLLVLAIAVFAAVIAGCTGTAPAADTGSVNTPPVTEKAVYIIGIDTDYPPYTFLDENGNPQGFDVECAKWIANDQGINIEFKVVPWEGIINELLNNNIDMIYSGMSITPERSALVKFSDIYWVTNYGVAVRKNSLVTIDQIMNGTAKIGAPKGTTTAEWIQKELIDSGKMPPEKLILYDTFPQALEALEYARIDAAIYDTPVVIESIDGKYLDFIGTIESGEKFGIAVRKDDAQLLSKLNAGLKNLKASPKWSELVNKYDLARR